MAADAAAIAIERMKEGGIEPNAETFKAEIQKASKTKPWHRDNREMPGDRIEPRRLSLPLLEIIKLN